MNAFLLLLADAEVIQGIINRSEKPTICVTLENVIKTLRVKEGKEWIELWKKEPQPHIGLSVISKIHIAMTLIFKECWDVNVNAKVGLADIPLIRTSNILKCLSQLASLDNNLKEATQAQDIRKFHQPSLIYKKEFPPREENKIPKKTDRTRPGNASKPPKQGAHNDNQEQTHEKNREFSKSRRKHAMHSISEQNLV